MVTAVGQLQQPRSTRTGQVAWADPVGLAVDLDHELDGGVGDTDLFDELAGLGELLQVPFIAIVL